MLWPELFWCHPLCRVTQQNTRASFCKTWSTQCPLAWHPGQWPRPGVALAGLWRSCGTAERTRAARASWLWGKHHWVAFRVVEAAQMGGGLLLWSVSRVWQTPSDRGLIPFPPGGLAAETTAWHSDWVVVGLCKVWMDWHWICVRVAEAVMVQQLSIGKLSQWQA